MEEAERSERCRARLEGLGVYDIFDTAGGGRLFVDVVTDTPPTRPGSGSTARNCWPGWAVHLTKSTACCGSV